MKLFLRLLAIGAVWFAGHWFIIRYNIPLFHAINGYKEKYFTDIMVWFTSIAEGHLAIILIVLAYRKRRAYLWSLLAGIVLVIAVITGLKIYFAHPRPPAVFSLDDFFLASNLIRSNSFPSGHSATAMILAFYFVTTLRSVWQKFLLFTLAVFAGISRIYIGVHFPIDVWYGLMISFVIMYLNLYVIEKKNLYVIWHNTLAESFLLNVVGFFTTVSFLFFYDLKEPIIKKELVILFSVLFVYFFVRLSLELFIMIKRKLENKE